MQLKQVTYVESGDVLVHVQDTLQIDGTDFVDDFWTFFWRSFAGGGSDAWYTLICADTFLEYVWEYYPASPAQQEHVPVSLYAALQRDPATLLCVDVED